MPLVDIWRSIATHGLAGLAGVALWHGWASRPGAVEGGQQAAGVAAGDPQRERMSRRARELAEEAATAHDRAVASWPEWTPVSSRAAAEHALANRDEIRAEWQREVDAFKQSAEKYRGDERLLEKLEEQLFEPGEDHLAAMLLALFLQDEDRALQEVCRRSALRGNGVLDPVLEALPADSLERWAAEPGLPSSLRHGVVRILGQRLGRNDDLDGLARAWAKVRWDDTNDPRPSFVDEFVEAWICTDPQGTVRRIFHEWPEDLRLVFIEQLEGFNQSRPIWTTALLAAMREAPWETVPEHLREGVIDDIDNADQLPDRGPPGVGNPTEPLQEGMDLKEAQQQLEFRVERLLDQGPDLLDQLADGRIAVDEVARHLAGRLPGVDRYPEAFAAVVFEKTAASDPVGALRYAEGKADPEQLASAGGEAVRVMMIYDERLDRALGAAALLPGTRFMHRDLIEGFVKWHDLAPRQADECLRAFPATHPLREKLEAASERKETK